MQEEPTSEHRPATPDSTLASSLHHGTGTIDDLTLALTNFSRVPSPDLQTCCCCGDENCETTKSWLALKNKLESRLVLSAEVGSALLQRHEAYVRQHEPSNFTPRKAMEEENREDTDKEHTEMHARVGELIRENAVLERRLTQALLNSEVAEASNRRALHDLEEARTTVLRLTAHHARSVGLDNRLATVLQENDDIRQERDSQTQRAKLAEARLAALKDRTDKLQAEVRRLQDDLELRRLQRLDFSGSLLQDVRSRLESLQSSRSDGSPLEGNAEVLKVLESLAADNEVLKTDNKELHKLLTESREDLQALQTEVAERSMIAPPIRVETPLKRSGTTIGSPAFGKDFLLGSTRRPPSVEPTSRVYEPLTPETSGRPLSPADSLLASATKYPTFNHVHPQYPSSHLSFEMDEHEFDRGPLPPDRVSKAVQTNRGSWSNPSAQLAEAFIDQLSVSPHDGRSESSSVLDGHGSPMSSLLERVHSLLHRMTQADALTLTNRLKRQRLRGADVKHLSRTTVGSILSEVSHLRAQYRMLLEDEKMSVLCTRKDLRGLFKLFKDVFEEMGQMRVTLNDVVLEPSIASRVSELALDPARAEAMERERRSLGTILGSSWMAPFSKLFGSSAPDAAASISSTPPRPTSRGRVRAPRSAPKIAPALAASATTVNVEFSGTSAGKSVTSVFSAHPDNADARGRDQFPKASLLPQSPKSATSNIRSVMGIFAGAPHPDDATDPWVVLPRAPRRVQSTFPLSDPIESRPATLGRSAVKKRASSQLSRGIDAVIDANIDSHLEDSEAGDIPGPLLNRALRRRGLSDSSIHSTFMSQADAVNTVDSVGPSLERSSVLQTLSRTMQNFKQVASHTISGVAVPSPQAGDTFEATGTTSGAGLIPRTQLPRASSPAFSILPNLSSWAAAGAALDSAGTRARSSPSNFYGEYSTISRFWAPESLP
ncbi:hypothetical protein F5I97DRAFT_1860900 [Phlebopus sp. FC_14]|nr:hypothetical protein F5I97DRAFT_1860900 [Phlebopus sp. FC_14]